MTYQLAVFGNPIAHSLSPKIHPIFAKQFGIDINYQAILVPTDGFALACQQFFDQGGFGCNVTAPFKADAFQWINQCSEYAQHVKVVNTIVGRKGILWGENTDGQGLINDLTNNKSLSLAGSNIIILGAGGAARGVLPALLMANPEKIIIVNRDQDKIKDMQQAFHCYEKVQGISWLELTQHSASADLVIDATSFLDSYMYLAGARWSSKTFFYDLKYRPEKTPLVHWAFQQALQADDGFGMLVEQAALSFQYWFDVSPSTKELVRLGPQALLT